MRESAEDQLDTEDPVLRVSGLHVATTRTPLLADVSFAIDKGERVGLIGESGSGKSLTALSIMGLLGDGLRSTGSVELAGHQGNLLTRSERSIAKIRGADMAMIFQEPMTALNPTMRVGAQVAEVMRIHGTVASKGAAKGRAIELLDQVGLPDAANIARSYPHQLSGGQRQRVVAAIALANSPDLLVCDEPTTALDVTVQALVLDLIVRQAEEANAALLFITHDLAVVATVCERVMVMYGGRIVEAGKVTDVFGSPRHHYTQGLLAASDLSMPDGSRRERRSLPTIAGSVPGAGHFPDGCVFRNRCDAATHACEEVPAWRSLGERAGFACVHPLDGADHDKVNDCLKEEGASNG